MRLGGRGERAALAVGERTYLRPGRERDAGEFVELMRSSLELHQPWSFPPTDPDDFRALIERAPNEDFELLLLCR